MEPSVQNIIASAEVTTSRRGSFWVGIEPVPGPLGTVMRGPMFVEWEAPADPQPGPPWVLVHGGGGQAIDYTVHVRRPSRLVPAARRAGTHRVRRRPPRPWPVAASPGHPRPDGPAARLRVPAPDLHPPARRSRQQSGCPPAHPVARRTRARRPRLRPVSVHVRADARRPRGDARARGGRGWPSCSDLVGPAIVVTHSAGGPGTFAGADARPDKVAALFAIETLGPPFLNRPEMGVNLAWGLACSPITYDPPVTDPSELDTVTEERAELGPIPITLQREPARRLAHLSQFPIAVVTAEASMFLGFDRHLVEFLAQGGCDVELVRLADHGVHGNGHMIMIRAQPRGDACGAHRLGGAQALTRRRLTAAPQ